MPPNEWSHRAIALWGPWSADSVASLARLSRLSRQHSASGISCVAVTRESTGWPAARIEESVRRQGGRASLPVAIAPSAGFDALAALAGSDALPAVVVADRSGRVVARCTPAELDQVLTLVAAGTWSGPEAIAGIRREASELADLVALSETDPISAFTKLDEVDRFYPHWSRDFATRRIIILMRADRSGEATELMRSSIAMWRELGDAGELGELATLWLHPRVNPAGRDRALAAEAARAAAEISGDADPNPWLVLLRTQMSCGDVDGAHDTVDRLMAIGDERMRARVSRIASRLPPRGALGTPAGVPTADAPGGDADGSP